MNFLHISACVIVSFFALFVSKDAWEKNLGWFALIAFGTSILYGAAAIVSIINFLK